MRRPEPRTFQPVNAFHYPPTFISLSGEMKNGNHLKRHPTTDIPHYPVQDPTEPSVRNGSCVSADYQASLLLRTRLQVLEERRRWVIFLQIETVDLRILVFAIQRCSGISEIS